MRRLAAAALACCLGSPVLAGEAVTFTANPIDHFEIGHPEVVRFGRFVWRGGFEIEASSRTVGGLSGLTVLAAGARLLAITDDGQMLAAPLERDAEGRPMRLGPGSIEPMAGLEGMNGDAAGKRYADTEGFDVAAEGAGGLVGRVSLEGTASVFEGTIGEDGFEGPLQGVPIPGDARRVRWSKGLEALAIAPSGGPLAGATVILAERAPRGGSDADRPGWILGGPKPGRFTVTDDGYDVTDAKFGPGGDLYILERLFTLGDGVRARVRRLPASELAPGATVTGDIAFEASLAHQIDNMEGLALWTDGKGRTIVSMISDNNRSFLQRTLYLEFELAPED